MNLNDFASDDESTEVTEILYSPAKESDALGIKILLLADGVKKIWINAQIESKTNSHIFYRYFVFKNSDLLSTVRGVIERSKENNQFVWLNFKLNQFNRSEINQITSTSNTIYFDQRNKVGFSTNDTLILNFEQHFIETEGDEIKISDDLIWCVCPFVSAYSILKREFICVNVWQMKNYHLKKSIKRWVKLSCITDTEKSMLESLLFGFQLNENLKCSFVLGISGQSGSGKTFMCESIARMLNRLIIDFDENILLRFKHQKKYLDNLLFVVKNPSPEIIHSIKKMVNLPFLLIVEFDESVDSFSLLNYQIKLSLPTNEDKRKIFGNSIPHSLLDHCNNYHQITKCKQLIQLNSQILNDQSLLNLIVKQLPSLPSKTTKQ